MTGRGRVGAGEGLAAAVLQAVAEGRTAPEMALMRLILLARDEGHLGAILDRAIALCRDRASRDRLVALRALAARHPDAFGRVRATAAAVPHDGGNDADPAGAMAKWAARFDRAAAVSPEASVALYSLGDPETLAAITEEVAEEIRRAGLLGADSDLLDVGCGIGRLEARLAGECRRIVGIDVSAGMVEEARMRCAGYPNVEISQTAGLDLEQFGTASFDGVVFLDTLPYCVSAGLAVVERLFAEVARVLRPDGKLFIANFSYRDDLDQDRVDVRRLARATGLEVQAGGTFPFRRWDAALFVLHKVKGSTKA
jgi:SAM-dependent methyltransferase